MTANARLDGSARGLAAAVLLLGAAGCSVIPASLPGSGPALERYREAVGAMRTGGRPPAPSDPGPRLVAEVLQRILMSHVAPPDPQRLVDRAIEGLRATGRDTPGAGDRALTLGAIGAMLASLDPYSAFLDAEHLRDMRALMHGERPGFGIGEVTDRRAGPRRVVASGDGMPAAQATVRFRSVMSWLDGGVAYTRIAHFDEQTARLLREALESLRRQGGDTLAGLVLDLRDNPGGLFEQGIMVAGAFLGPVEIVSTRGRAHGEQHLHGDAGGDRTDGLPMVVLIDGGTSSAAEVVAGALQDHRRALLFGARSYGKGTVQTIFPLPGGEGLRLTTAHSFRPSGASMECFGITPDLEIMPPGRLLPPALRPADRKTERGPRACDPGGAAPPPPPRRRTLAELCPEHAGALPWPGVDGPLECAFAALRGRRVGAGAAAPALMGKDPSVPPEG